MNTKTKGYNNQSPITIAAMYSRYGVFVVLSENGSDIDEKGQFNSIILYIMYPYTMLQ